MKKQNNIRKRTSRVLRAGIIPAIIFVLCAVNGIPQPVINGGDPSSSSHWTLLREDDGIELYERWVTLDGYPEGRQLGIVFRLKGDIADALQLLTDEQLASQWMSSIKSFKVLEQVNDACWYSYILYDIPWPLKKQDLVARNTCTSDPDGEKVKIEMISDAAHIAENKGVSRIQHMTGMWQFTAEPGRTVHVSYAIFSGQRSSFPRWLTDPIIQGNLVRTMKNFRAKAEELQNYKNSVSRNKPFTSNQ